MRITVENVSYVYNDGTPLAVPALDGINCALDSGEVLGILGRTGSGKTTLIRLLGGLAAPTRGRVLADDMDMRRFVRERKLRVGVVFQRPERGLFEETVEREISYVLRHLSGGSPKEIDSKVAAACQWVGLDLERFRERSPLSLSDGLKRKVAIAAVLAGDPQLLILDEPAVGLDPPSTAELVEMLERMKSERRMSIVLVSHDMEAFLPLLDRMLVLADGRAAAFGTPAQVCEALGDDPAAQELLPDLARVVRDLRRAGVPLDPDEFRVPVLVERIMELARTQGGAS